MLTKIIQEFHFDNCKECQGHMHRSEQQGLIILEYGVEENDWYYKCEKLLITENKISII